MALRVGDPRRGEEERSSWAGCAPGPARARVGGVREAEAVHAGQSSLVARVRSGASASEAQAAEVTRRRCCSGCLAGC